MRNISEYKTWLLDCDGVIFDSNAIKTQAFWNVTIKFGKSAAEAFAKYHKDYGGISRYEKMSYFEKYIANESSASKLLLSYSKQCKIMLTNCKEVPGLREFLAFVDAKKFVVSGGDESELRSLFKDRDLERMFDDIYGSPKSKGTIIQQLKSQNIITYPAVFLGDSKHDYITAKEAGLDFIFMSGFTEFEGWKEYFEHKNIRVVRDFLELTDT